MRLADKVALITGGASGIGRATALRFAQEGAKVVVADINRGGGEATVASILATGGEGVFVPTDVSRPEELAQAVNMAVEGFGGLHILYNNAYWTDARTALETSPDNWQKTIDVTLRAVLDGSNLATPHLQKEGGVILNTASIHSIVGFPGYAAYQAAKGGVLALTRALALELAPKIRVVAILPGAIDTPAMRISDDLDIEDLVKDVPLGRVGKPEEIANTALFLASDEASYITGTAIVADGGFTTK